MTNHKTTIVFNSEHEKKMIKSYALYRGFNGLSDFFIHLAKQDMEKHEPKFLEKLPEK